MVWGVWLVVGLGIILIKDKENAFPLNVIKHQLNL